jgi:aminoglycoside phosphotransferase (APT) family kinase protein
MPQSTQTGHGEESELKQPRADERLPLERLIPYLRLHLDKASGKPSLAQFPGGRANLSYLIRFDEQEYALRRPPLSPVVPRERDMKREYSIPSKLCDQFRLVPRSYLYRDDDSIIGALFQIMERRRGLVIRDQMPAPFDDNLTTN